MNTQQIISELEAECGRLKQAIEALRGRKKPGSAKGERRLNRAAKKRISEAMKKRWAERKKVGSHGTHGGIHKAAA